MWWRFLAVQAALGTFSSAVMWVAVRSGFLR